LAACRKIGGCPTGEARITSGFALKARWIIHTVAPIWKGDGLLFYELEHKKAYYPTRKDEEAVNPDGTGLR
jgi:O-acetyl-ADP-ribose deacetylase (regulator of RNase III)